MTPAEARLAVKIAQGKPPKEAAREIGIRYSTARTHLKRVFAKMGVDRQAELVRLLLTAVPQLRDA